MKVKFFFFVNTRSGGQKGKILLSSFPKRVFLKNNYTDIPGYCDLQSVDAVFFDMFESKDREAGFSQIHYFSNKIEESVDDNRYENCFVFACGGDGTVIWILEELIKNKANFERTVISTIPLGTGNDFSFITGFGCNFSLLKIIIKFNIAV